MFVRRRTPPRWTTTVGLVVLVALSACGGESSPGQPDDQASNGPTAPDPSNGSSYDVTTPLSVSEPTDAFPITIDHVLGSTLIPSPPQRVLALATEERDTIFALGITPLPVRIAEGRVVNSDYPWAEYATSVPESPFLYSPDGVLDYELVAALKPDLILNVTNIMPAEVYETLSKIAPTVTEANEERTTWQDVTRDLGRALGRSDGADKLVSDVEAHIDQVASDNPQFAGKTVAVASYSGPTEDIFINSDVPHRRVLEALGFDLSSTSTRLTPAEFDELDVDVLIWYAGAPPEKLAQIKGDPRLHGLAVMQENRAVFLEGTLSTGLQFWVSALSLPYLVDELTPLLQVATS